MRLLGAFLLAFAVFGTACGADPAPVADDPPSTPRSTFTMEPSPDGEPTDKAPPIEVQMRGGKSHILEPWSLCWANRCADGVPPNKPFSVGGPKFVEFTFDAPPGWEFKATFIPVDRSANPENELPARVKEISAGTYRIFPTAKVKPGPWHVTLFGSSSSTQELSATFAWRIR